MTTEELKQLSCLIVDDDSFMLSTLSLLLKQFGVKQVFQADNAQDGLKLIANRNNHIDIVISDLNMPEMDGIQLLRHLGALGVSLGVILVSGEDPRLLESVQNLGKQYQLRVLGSISKPVKKDILMQYLLDFRREIKPSPQGPATMVFADELQAAILSELIEVWYQPQIDVQTYQLVGVEALARWQHPEKGFIPPNIFIGIAEKYGMIQQLTDSVLKQSIKQISEWNKVGFNISLSVNFSAAGLCHLEMPEVLHSTLRNSGLRPDHLNIEVTESALPKDTSATLDILTRLRLKGFGLSIDDFGTGFSSLEQLRLIPFTELKIDRSFVHNAADNKASQAILESSISLAKRLSIKCVAEGVETQEDWDLVAGLGCDTVQGYFIAKPMPAEDFVPWVRQYSKKHRTKT